jgi:DNA-binding CsgD family transcriptional regulator/tetratricopeptide (TPR) repeat protein
LLVAIWAHDDGLIEAIRASFDAHILILDPAGEAYRFRHALMRDVVYFDMLPGERRRWHGKIAHCLTQDPRLSSGQTMSQAAERAHHWHSAGDWPRALETSLEAARAFGRSHAYAESHKQFRRVIDAWELIGPQSDVEVNRVDLLIEAAEAARLACDAESAIGLLEQVIDTVDADQDPMLAASLQERLGRCLWEDGRTDQAQAAHQRGNALLLTSPDSELRARLLAAEGRMLMVSSRYQESLEICSSAVKMARYVKAPAAELDASITLGVDLVMTGDAPAGLALLRESCSMAGRTGGVEDLVRAYGNLAAALGRLTEFEQSVIIADEGLAELNKRMLPRSVGGLLLTNVCESLFALGRWDEAEHRIIDALQTRLPAIDAAFLYRTLGEIHTARGEFDDAERALGKARKFANELREPQYIASLHVAFATLAVDRGDRDTARIEVDRALTASSESGLEDVAILACAVGLHIEADEVEARRGRRQSNTGEVVAAGERFWTLGQDRAEAAKTSGVDLRDCDAALALCAAEFSRLQGHSDDALWSASATAWRERHKPYAMATSLYRQAEVSLSRQQRTVARPLLAEALRVANGLGATPLSEQVKELAHRSRLALGDDAAVAAPAEQPAVPGNPALTPREVDVLGYLIDGMTNREIAAALFISLKTVDKHVSNLMDKLQVRNRVEAAAIGQRLLQATAPTESTGTKSNGSRGRQRISSRPGSGGVRITPRP